MLVDGRLRHDLSENTFSLCFVGLQRLVEFVMLLRIKGGFDVKAAHDVVCQLPSGRVEEDASEEGCDVSWAVSGSEAVYSWVCSDWIVCVV